MSQSIETPVFSFRRVGKGMSARSGLGELQDDRPSQGGYVVLDRRSATGSLVGNQSSEIN